jgi:hypothetical protein
LKQIPIIQIKRPCWKRQVHLEALALAEGFKKTYSELPNDTQLDDLFPKPFSTGINGKVYHGPYEGMTREEIFSMFPEWNSLYSQATIQQKMVMSHVLRGLNKASRIGIHSLGDLRIADNQILNGLRSSKGEENASTVIIKMGLANR